MPEAAANPGDQTGQANRALDQIYPMLTEAILDVREGQLKAARIWEEIAGRLPATDPEGLSARRSALALVIGQYDDFYDELLARYLSEPDIPPEFVTEIHEMNRAVYGDSYQFPVTGEPSAE